MSESMSYYKDDGRPHPRLVEQRKRDEAEARRKLIQPYIDRIEALEALAISPEEAGSLILALQGRTEVTLDYLHAREKLKLIAASSSE